MKHVNERMREYRARLRERGFVQVTDWVPAERVEEHRDNVRRMREEAVTGSAGTVTGDKRNGVVTRPASEVTGNTPSPESAVTSDIRMSVADADRASLMAMWRKKGCTWAQVAGRLNEHGERTSRGNRWSENSARLFGKRRGVR